jgi:hypothetical protein
MLVQHRCEYYVSARSILFRNFTEDPVNGLHVIFNGSGALRGARITIGPPGGITTNDNQVNVFLNAPLAPGMFLCFTVSSGSAPIEIQTALWSSNFNVTGQAEAISPESTSAR